MHFVEILEWKSKQPNNKNFNEIAHIFQHQSVQTLPPYMALVDVEI